MKQDVRYALRLAQRRPGFTALVVLILAIGVGANTAIFSLINGVLLQPLEYPEPDRLFRLYHKGLDGRYERGSPTPGSFTDWKNQTTSFQAMAAFYGTAQNLTGQGEPERVVGTVSSGSVFDVLGVPPLLGRTFRPDEDQAGVEPVVVLSYGMWQRLFDGDSGVLGRTLTLDSAALTIVGVMPQEFRFPRRSTEYWVPARWGEEFRYNRFEYWMRVIGRLKSDRTVESAQAELETVMARLRRDYPEENDKVGVNMVPLHEQVIAGVENRLYILMGAVGFVLLIACVNLANLFLARSNSRRQEIAMRQALGAGRGRLVAQVLTESVALGLVGSAAGLALGWGLQRVIVTYLLGNLPRVDSVGIDAGVFAFTAAAGVLAGVLFGLLPALQTARVAPVQSLRESGRGSRGSRRVRQLLVVSEVALALVLLVGAGLLIRSLFLLQQVEPGFRTERLLTFRISLPAQKYQPAQRTQFFTGAQARINRIPGVISNGAITTLPVAGRGNGAWFNILGRPWPQATTPPVVGYRIMLPGYFKTMGIPLLAGRLPDERDQRETAPAVVVNQALVDRYFADEDPLGHEIVLGPLEEEVINPPSKIVGVVKTVKHRGLGSGDLPVVYLPHAVTPQWTVLEYAVRTRGQPGEVMPQVRAQIAEMDPTLPIYNVSAMEEVISRTLTPTRSALILLGAFAGVAVLLAAVGVFGVLSYSVSQRSRELGIRAALGADRSRLFSLVLREGLLQTSAGIALGLVGALALTRLMEGMLFGVSPMDPITLAAVVATLLVVAFLASSLPARRAGRLDPMSSLRDE